MFLTLAQRTSTGNDYFVVLYDLLIEDPGLDSIHFILTLLDALEGTVNVDIQTNAGRIIFVPFGLLYYTYMNQSRLVLKVWNFQVKYFE